MSLRRESLKDAYNRAGQKCKDRQEARADSRENFWEIWAEMQEYYFEETHPSMYEVRWGKLLTLLEKLKIRAASNLLDKWYW